VTATAGAGDLAFANSTTIDGNGSVTVDGGAVTCFTVTSASNVIRDLSITDCSIGVLVTGDPADGNALRGNTIQQRIRRSPDRR
jgi:nitrous oxidase accessory protein NosD